MILNGSNSITNTEFSQKGTADNTTLSYPYAVYMTGGSLRLENIYMEDLRLGYFSGGGAVSIQDVFTNASWMTISNFPHGVWAVYNNNCPLFMRNCNFRNAATAYASIYSSGPSDIAGITLPPGGCVWLPPASNAILNSTIEGYKVGGYFNLLPDWNFAHWIDSGDLVFWGGTGYGTCTFAQDSTYASVMQTGSASNLKINVTADASSYLSGVKATYPTGNQQWVTAVAFGRVNNTAYGLQFYSPHQVGGTIVSNVAISGDSNYFVAATAINLAGLAAGSADYLMFGFSPGQSFSSGSPGTLWLGSIVLIPGKIPLWEATALYMAAPTTSWPSSSGAGAPTFNAWQTGLIYINTIPSPHTVYTSVQTGTGASDWVQP